MLDSRVQHYASGALYRIERFTQGVKNGLQEAFYEDGSLKTLEFYKDGLREGEVLLYWPNHRLKRRLYFSAGKRHGLEETWDSAGRVGFIGTYHEGNPIELHQRFSDGILAEEVEWTPSK